MMAKKPKVEGVQAPNCPDDSEFKAALALLDEFAAFTVDDEALIRAYSTKKGLVPKFSFLHLPIELRDEVTDGLDSRRMTLREASELCRKHGHQVSYEAIRTYHRFITAVRNEMDFTRVIKVLLHQLDSIEPVRILKGFLTLTMTVLSQGMLNGEEVFSRTDPAKMVGAVKELWALFDDIERARLKGEYAKGIGPALGADEPKEVDARTKKTIQQVYGI
jgi:hypothetical protein